MNLLSVAELVELNRMRAAAAGISVEPQRLRKLRLLAVRRPASACGVDRAPPECNVSAALIRAFLISLGTNPDGVALVDVPGGTIDDVLKKSETALKWEPDERCG